MVSQKKEILKNNINKPPVSLKSNKKLLSSPTSPVRLDQVYIDPAVLKPFPLEKAFVFQTLPLHFEGQTLVVAMEEKNNIWALDFLKKIFPQAKTFRQLSCDETALKKLITLAEEVKLSAHDLLTYLAQQSLVLPTQKTQEAIIRTVNALCYEALSKNASDLHFDPQNSNIIVRTRIDGVLHTTHQIPKNLWTPLLGRLKILAQQKTTLKRLPQTGRFQLTYQGQSYDIRLATQPTHYGERAVIRLLSAVQTFSSFETLGFSEKDATRFQDLAKLKEGLILVCGPTGSGKTTTLQTFLQQVGCHKKNVMTLEQPIEYTLENANQTEIQDQEDGFDFAEGLRSILRHDPDVILVGEIRDTETAQMTLRAAMTGHLVFSTLHTPDVAGIFPRLNDLGITPQAIAPYLKAVIAQRLVRTICQSCHGNADVKNNCPYCFGTGYRGRTVIYELLHVSPTFKNKLILTKNLEACLQLVTKNLSHTLYENAQQKVQQGLTSQEEIYATLDHDNIQTKH